jgi:predicted Zn-dependent protease
METNQPDRDEEKTAALLAAVEKDLPPPDREFLAKLREQSTAAFRATKTPRKRFMIFPSLRWAAAAAAVVLVLGFGLAHWVMQLTKHEEGPDDKFVVSDTLTDDGRVGKVSDAQGVVSVRPVLQERWSPVQPNLVLKPGDMLRTDSRGGNVVAVRLVKSTSLIVGPHSVVELLNPKEINIFQGEVEIDAPAEAGVEIVGPSKDKTAVKGKQLYRVQQDKLVAVAAEPLWLKGFKGATANESIGSLVAGIDGRSVPLTVGYHKVKVDIRDQIARTVVEESFVNRTKERLEGVFYFPLPHDASISGFGMWIGEQLIEADIVEKQRAREIYETIKAERRDPGLLEWTGGNIFKASIFPIEAFSEKRIKISYTQVLPLSGSHYRYGYGLQSDLLREHPLRDLSIDVKIDSAVPLKTVSSPTHPTRTDKTEHAAHVEFHAQEYTPMRDFEVVVELDARQADVVVIPHRRGDDGYFMVQLLPPDAQGDWERPLLTDGAPLRLLILADTSASIDAGQRNVQNALLAALLAALTPKDTINVAACDVQCDWIFPNPIAATTANIATIRETLARRSSLGWTDLEPAFTSALKQSDDKTHVIYLGDGIVTAGNADPVEFARKLHRLYEGKKGTFHAVALGASYEPAALKAIASLGGGSVRHVSGEQGPQAVALELLKEITSPALRDLKVEFKGLTVARVYPQELPNLAPGSQQIILGRYRPQGDDQQGEIVITGKQGDRSVRYSTRMSLRDAEQGNSFIPRLWARMHLDRLLEQGKSAEIQDEIIHLSEDYKIITPYTSLLVLETDADRERFKVKRRFQMRDGEKYFNEGRDNAVFALMQKQMKKAGDWRIALRKSVLAQLTALGRDAQLFNPRPRYPRRNIYFGALGVERLGDLDELAELSVPGLAGSVEEFGLAEKETAMLGDFLGREMEVDRAEAAAVELGKALRDPEADMELMAGDEPAGTPMPAGGPVADERYLGGSLGRVYLPAGLISSVDADGLLTDAFGRVDWGGRGGRYAYRSRPRPTQWIDNLFPNIPTATVGKKEATSTWPAEAKAIARSLLRNAALAKLPGGVEVIRRVESFEPRWKELTGRSDHTEILSPAAWLTRNEPAGGQTIVSWCDKQEYGSMSLAFLLGRMRAANAEDLKALPYGLGDYSTQALDLAYPDHQVKIEKPAADRVLLILTHPNNLDDAVRVLIDTRRHVVLSIEQRHRGILESTAKFDDFVEVAGSSWAQRLTITDHKGRTTSVATQKIAALSADEVKQHVTKQLADRAKVQFLKMPFMKVSDAKKAQAALGRITFDQQFVLMLHFAQRQRWARAEEYLRQCEKLAAGKAGMRWLRDAFWQASRRHEELRKRSLAEAEMLARSAAGAEVSQELFLAEQLMGQARSLFEANETLKMLDVLRPVYDRQAAFLQGGKSWRRLRLGVLQRAGQSDLARSVAKQLALDYPHDYTAQQEYAQALFQAGDYTSGYAWIDRTLADKNVQWETQERDALRDLRLQHLELQGRFRELADYLAPLLKQSPEPENYWVYERYLSALIRGDQVDKAETIMKQWLKEGQVGGNVPPAVTARLHAAIYTAIGQGHNLYSNHILERWHQPLAETALFLAKNNSQLDLADAILANSRWQSTDEGKNVRKALLALLVSDLNKLAPRQIDHLVNWLWTWGVERTTWQQIAQGLSKRWLAENKPEEKHTLAQPIIRILSWLGGEEYLSFLRVQWQQGPEKYRSHYAEQLFAAFLAQPWAQAIEDEAFTMLDKLARPDDDEVRKLFVRVAALHRLTDAMLENGYQARLKALKNQQKLTRVELRDKQNEFRKLAREGFADRLKAETAKQTKPFAGWLLAERLYIEMLLDRNLNQVAADCWAQLGNDPPKPATTDSGEVKLETVLETIFRQRFLTMIVNLAARKTAEPALVDRLRKYLERAVAQNPDDASWRQHLVRLLVARDNLKDLEQILTEWSRGDDPDNRWRLTLGYLAAEQGRFKDAIRLFEAVETADELGPADYRTLAGWYLVDNQREEHEKARAAVYKTEEEYPLSRRLYAYLNPWLRQDHLPTELDQEVMTIFAALFEKSASPRYYLQQLLQFYRPSRDSRLLAVMVDGVVGHSAGKVYPFLAGMLPVFAELRDEAAVDEIVVRIAAVRQRAKTPVDQRALDLLEALAERRAAELQNQPGPHAAKALAAMERAFKREWSAGEPRLMADLLGQLGAVAQLALAQEQLRELRELHGKEAVGTYDRLHIAHRFATTLHAYARTVEAVDLLTPALKEFEDANQGQLLSSAQNALDSLVGFHEALNHHVEGEKLLAARLLRPIHEQQKLWLTMRQNRLYHHALEHDSEVSLGKGAALYRALERKLQTELGAADNSDRSPLNDLICHVYHTAHAKKLASVKDDLKEYAFRKLPAILKEHVSNYESMIGVVAERLHEIAGARDAIAFLVERAEAEPGWLRYANQDTWTQFAYRIGQWLQEVKDMGDAEPGLLRFVLHELRRDLESREQRYRAVYWKHAYYWAAKENDFARVAEEVLTQRKQSSDAVEYIADYLYAGIEHRQRAIEILFAAHKDKVLAESGQAKLVSFLHGVDRFAESVPLLLPLVELRPDDLQYRVWLMHAYFRTQRQAELLALLKQTEAFFREKDRWNESALAGLAASCAQNQLYNEALAYFAELILLHQRTQPGRGIGRGTLSTYYTQQAQAFAGLKKTREAVEAAAGAVVAWGPTHSNRGAALENLKNVIVQSPDLDAFVKELDKEPLQSAIVRKAIGQAYVQKKEPAKAIPQFELAAELQPNDAEVKQALVKCYDDLGDKQGAIEQILKLVQVSRRDLGLYQSLGERWQAAMNKAEAERAFTSIIEVMPNEAESHALFAEVRQKQDRWQEAIEHWERVASLRALEPTGLLGLTRSYIHEKQWDKATESIRKLRSKTWPDRFAKVNQEISELEKEISKAPR